MGFSLVTASIDYALVEVHRILPEVASLVVEHRLWNVGASVAVTHGLSSCGAQA